MNWSSGSAPGWPSASATSSASSPASTGTPTRRTGSEIARSSSSARSGTTSSIPARRTSAKPTWARAPSSASARTVSTTRTRLARVDRCRPQRRQEARAHARAGDAREELLALVHDEQQLGAGAGQQRLRGADEPVVVGLEPRGEPGRRSGGREPGEHRGQLGERRRARLHLGHEDARRRRADGRDEPCPHRRGLPAPRRAHEREQPRRREPLREAAHQALAAAEVERVRLQERPQPLVRVARGTRGRHGPGRTAGGGERGEQRIGVRVALPRAPAPSHGRRPAAAQPTTPLPARRRRGAARPAPGPGCRRRHAGSVRRPPPPRARHSAARPPRSGRPRGRDVPGDAEVREVCVALLVEEDVRRLDVAVHDALAVRRGERGRDLLARGERLRRRQRPALERLPQAPAAQVAHHEVRAVRLSPVVVERDDVRVLDPRHELRLGLEAADELRVVGQRRADDLDRDLAPDVRLDRPVDDPEGAFADPLEQLQPAQRSPRDVESRVLREDLRLEAAQVGRSAPARARPSSTPRARR